jgi:type VI secretion system protein ImpC
MAEGAGAPLLAAASPGLLGCPTAAQLADPSGWQPDLPAAVAKAWDALRGRPEATRLGLVVPRFLLRMPYGAESCPLESLPFTERPDPEDHDGYLWGNPALVGGVLLGCAFSEQGWGFDPSRALAMEDLPLYTFERDGEYCAKPCAETLLSQRVAERILAAGLMPLLPVRGSGSALLAAWQSVHASGAALQLRSAGS